MNVQVALESKDLFIFTFDEATMQDMKEFFSSHGMSFQEIFQGPRITISVNGFAKDINSVINFVAGRKVVPEWKDHRYNYYLLANDSLSGAYLVFLFNNKYLFEDHEQFSNAKIIALVSYFRTMQLSDRKPKFAEFENKVSEFDKNLSWEIEACEELYWKLQRGEELSMEYLEPFYFLSPRNKLDLVLISQSEIAPTFSQEVLELKEAKEFIAEKEGKTYSTVIKRKNEIFSTLFWKPFSSFEDAISDVRMLRPAEVISSSIFKMKEEYRLYVKMKDSDLLLSEFFYKPIPEIGLHYPQENGELILDDAVSIIHQHQL